MFKKVIFFILVGLLAVNIVHAEESMAIKLGGRILLQVEENGEAWYVNPANFRRYYLGRPNDAFKIMRELGIGISNKNLEKIQVANVNLLSGVDTDKDGLSDSLEDAVGMDKNNSDTDSNGYGDKEELLNGYISGLSYIDENFAAVNTGKIFLQVESHGEAWYLNKTDLKRYYLGRPDDAFNIMRSLGLGISNVNLEKIVMAGSYNPLPPTGMEKMVYDLVNKQRNLNGLSFLRWNDDLAGVAREHSVDLAKENFNLIKYDIKCSLPMIHHEGFDFGFYSQDRLKSREVYYFRANAENIALIPKISSTRYHINKDSVGTDINNCNDFFIEINDTLKEKLEEDATEEAKKSIIEKEIGYRKKLVESQPIIGVEEVYRKSSQDVENEAVVGWMNSLGHRMNILTVEYDEAGVGIAEVNDYLIITQVFITRAECGYNGGHCCEKAERSYCYQPLTCSGGVCSE